ncbi:MAG: Crp/Fnr family transcriptional regulator [Hyphomonadaceae bacterium]
MRSITYSAYDRLIKGLRSIGTISPADEDIVRRLPLRLQSVGAHQDVVHEGDRPTECCVILEGFVCRHKAVAGGQRQILSFHLPGDLPDLQSLHLEVVDFSLGSLTASQVAFIPHSALREGVRASPTFADLLWRSTMIDAAIFRAWLASVGRRNAYQRVAHLFCEVFVRMKSLGLAEEMGFMLPITQVELGDALGLSAVHVNRTLQQLRQDGVIVSRGRYNGFTDWERLKKAGDFDPSYLFTRPFA